MNAQNPLPSGAAIRSLIIILLSITTSTNFGVPLCGIFVGIAVAFQCIIGT